MDSITRTAAVVVCMMMVVAFMFLWWFRRQRKEYVFFESYIYLIFRDQGKLSRSFVEERRSVLDNAERTAKGRHTKYSFGQMKFFFEKFVDNIPEELQAALSQDAFRYSDYVRLKELYRTKVDSISEETIEQEANVPLLSQEGEVLQKSSREEVLNAVRKEVLLYTSRKKKPKHYADRMVGFLIKEKYIEVQGFDRTEAWAKFIGNTEVKVEPTFLYNPEYNKNQTDKTKFESQLKDIKEFLIRSGVEFSS